MEDRNHDGGWSSMSTLEPAARDRTRDPDASRRGRRRCDCPGPACCRPWPRVACSGCAISRWRGAGSAGWPWCRCSAWSGVRPGRGGFTSAPGSAAWSSSGRRSSGCAWPTTACTPPGCALSTYCSFFFPLGLLPPAPPRPPHPAAADRHAAGRVDGPGVLPRATSSPASPGISSATRSTTLPAADPGRRPRPASTPSPSWLRRQRPALRVALHRRSVPPALRPARDIAARSARRAGPARPSSCSCCWVAAWPTVLAPGQDATTCPGRASPWSRATSISASATTLASGRHRDAVYTITRRSSDLAARRSSPGPT